MPEPLISPNAAPNAGSPSQSAAGAPPAADSAQQQNSQQQNQQQAAQRPDYIPEAYWDAETGAPKLEDFGKAFGELSQFKTDADAKLAAVPEKPEGYAVPEALVDDDVAKIIPQGHEITLDEKSPLLEGFRAYAHANKLSQEQFAEGVKLYIKQQVVEEKAFADAREAELKKLGGNGPQRQKAVSDFITGMVGEADAGEILKGVFSAKQFEALERLQQKVINQGNVIPLHQKRDNQSDTPATELPRERRMFPSMAG